MSQIEVIQLTERNNSPKWLKKDNTFVQMVDMEDKELQKALLICQQRKIRLFMSLIRDINLEDELKSEAKKRGFELKDLDDTKENWIAGKFYEFKQIMITATTSMKRKAKEVIKTL